MTEVAFDVPDDVRLALKFPTERLGDELRLAAAVKFFELGRLSSGAAARLAGLPVPLFLAKLADYGVAALRLKEPEIREDAKGA
jgi:predicted HTH domain antitoxin